MRFNGSLRALCLIVWMRVLSAADPLQCYGYWYSVTERVTMPSHLEHSRDWQTVEQPTTSSNPSLSLAACKVDYYEIQWPDGTSAIEAYWGKEFVRPYDPKKDFRKHFRGEKLPCESTHDILTGAQCKWIYTTHCFTHFCNDIIFPRNTMLVRMHNYTKDDAQLHMPTMHFERALPGFLKKAKSDALGDVSLLKQPYGCNVEYVWEPYGRRVLRSRNPLNDPLDDAVFYVENSKGQLMWCAMIISKMETSYGMMKIPRDIRKDDMTGWRVEKEKHPKIFQLGSDNGLYCWWRQPGVKQTEEQKNVLTKLMAYRKHNDDELLLCVCGEPYCNNDKNNWLIRKLLPHHLVPMETPPSITSNVFYASEDVFQRVFESTRGPVNFLIPLILLLLIRYI